MPFPVWLWIAFSVGIITGWLVTILCMKAPKGSPPDNTPKR